MVKFFIIIAILQFNFSEFNRLSSGFDTFRIIRKKDDVIATIEYLSEHENPSIAIVAAKTLAKLGNPQGLLVLNRLSCNQDLWVQLELARAYLDLKIKETGLILLDKLVKGAISKNDYELLLEIAGIFLDLEDYKRVDEIIFNDIFEDKFLPPVIKQKRNMIQKRFIRESIMQMYKNRAIDETKKIYDRAVAIEEILRRLSDNDLTVGEIEIAKETLSVLVNDSNLEIRSILAEALAIYPNHFDWSIEILNSLLHQESAQVYLKAFEAICNWARFYDQNYLELFIKFSSLPKKEEPELIGQLSGRDKIKQMIEESKRVRELSLRAQRILRELIVNEEIIARKLDEIRISFDEVAALWVIYGFERAREILDNIAKIEEFSINLRKEAINFLSFRVEEWTMVRLLALVENENSEIYRAALNSVLRPWWIYRIEIKLKLLSLLEREEDPNIILDICEAFIKWDKDYDKQVIEDILIEIALNERAVPWIRMRAIELLGEL